MAALLAGVIPAGSANHGQFGGGTAQMADGSTLDVAMRYESGDNNKQTWAFSFASADGFMLACKGIGSIENGFRSGATCPSSWRTGGTGEAHEAGSLSFDAHVVTFLFDDKAGTLQQSVLGV